MESSIKNLLQKSIKKAGIDRQVNAAIVCNEFDRIILELLGDKVKNKVKAMYVKNGTLSIAVTSSAVGQEIKLNEPEIMEKLEKKVGENQVQGLRFLV